MKTPMAMLRNLETYATFKFQNFYEESINLRLFPFSLHDRARAWLDSNTPGSITSRESLLSKFYNKFFLMSKVNEKFSESWERFKDLFDKMPSTWI